jgi:pimeloyl-ACP methyl ester carboxylesterase
MPNANNNNVDIHYEIEGHGPPLLLMHGLTSSMVAWKRYGYVEKLRMDYMLILVDARGHGDSGKPHDSQAYSAELMTGDIVAVLDDLDVDKAVYWGYSMGGMIGFELPRHYNSRLAACIIGGMSPYRSVEERQSESWMNTSLRVGAEAGPEAYISILEKHLGSPAEDEKARMLENDYKAIYALWENMSRWPATADQLPTITGPCLFYTGDQDIYHDGAKEAAKNIQQGNFVSIPNLAHLTAYMRSDLILPHVKRFLKSVTI